MNEIDDAISDDEHAQKTWAMVSLKTLFVQGLRDSWRYLISAALVITAWVLTITFLSRLPAWAVIAAWAYIVFVVLGVPVARLVKNRQRLLESNAKNRQRFLETTSGRREPPTTQEIEEVREGIERNRARGFRTPISKHMWLRWIRVVVPRTVPACAELWLTQKPVIAVIFGAAALTWPFLTRLIPGYRKTFTLSDTLIGRRPPGGLPTPEI
jgi:hypothetical protein